MAAAGGAGDAIYSDGDTITISFNATTDRAGAPPGRVYTAAMITNMLSCTAAPAPRHVAAALAASTTTPSTPFPISSFGPGLTATWASDTELTLTVGTASGAAAEIRAPLYTDGARGAMVGRLSCCMLRRANVREAGGVSMPSTACSPPLIGSWGSLDGPSPSNITLTDPQQSGVDLSVGDLITISFDQPTDRGGVPLGWEIPYEVLEQSLLWWPRPLMSYAPPTSLGLCPPPSHRPWCHVAGTAPRGG